MKLYAGQEHIEQTSFRCSASERYPGTLSVRFWLHAHSAQSIVASAGVQHLVDPYIFWAKSQHSMESVIQLLYLKPQLLWVCYITVI